MKAGETLGYDLIVEEEELLTQLQRIKVQAESYEETIGQYIEMLKNTVSVSVTEGSTAQNLKAFYLETLGLKGEIQEIINMINGLTMSYQISLDEADSYLY